MLVFCSVFVLNCLNFDWVFDAFLQDDENNVAELNYKVIDIYDEFVAV